MPHACNISSLTFCLNCNSFVRRICSHIRSHLLSSSPEAYWCSATYYSSETDRLDRTPTTAFNLHTVDRTVIHSEALEKDTSLSSLPPYAWLQIAPLPAFYFAFRDNARMERGCNQAQKACILIGRGCCISGILTSVAAWIITP